MPNSVFYGGQFAVPNQAIGDLLVANTIQSWTGLPDVAAGAILQSGGVGAAPSYTTKPNIVSTLNAATGNEVAFTIAYTVNKATSGNDTGLLIAMTDTASPGTSLPLDVQVGGATVANIRNDGRMFSSVGLLLGQSSAITVTNRLNVGFDADGVVRLTNAASNGFTGLILGPSSTSGIRIKKNGTAFDLRLGDDSAYASLSALSYSAGAVAGTASATFTSQDGKTVTVTGGIITSVV